MGELESLVASFAGLYMQLMRTLDRRMAEQGASLARTKMLLVVQKRGPLRAKDIAEYFEQSPRTVTESIDGLERDGLVQREPDPSDRRAKLVRITPKGVEAAAKTEPLRRQMIEQAFGILDPAEREALREILAKISSAVVPEGLSGGC